MNSILDSTPRPPVVDDTTVSYTTVRWGKSFRRKPGGAS